MPDEEAQSAADAITIHRFHPGDTLFEEGAPSAGLWVLFKGRVRLAHATPDGRELVTALRGRESMLEVASALDGGGYGTTAVARDPAIAGLLPRDELLRVFRYRRMNSLLVGSLCQAIRQQDIRLAVTATKSAAGRVICNLLHLARTYGVLRADSVTIQYQLTRQDVADLAGLRIETVIRIVTDLERQGLIRRNGRILEIPSQNALRALNGCSDCLFECAAFAPLAAANEARSRVEGVARAVSC